MELCFDDSCFDGLFGFELEFFSRVPYPSPSDCIDDVVRKMADAGFDVANSKYSGTSYDKWQVKPDSSIKSGVAEWHGFEIVSPKLSGCDHEQALRRLVDLLVKQFKIDVNSTCGMHVHIDCSKYVAEADLSGLKIICCNFAVLEIVVDLILPNQRRRGNNTYCRSNSDDMIDEKSFDALRKCKSVDEVIHVVNFGLGREHRRFKLNLQPLKTLGSLEIRSYPATTAVDDMLCWIKFCRVFIHESGYNKNQTVQLFGKTPQLQVFFQPAFFNPQSGARQMFESLVRCSHLRHFFYCKANDLSVQYGSGLCFPRALLCRFLYDSDRDLWARITTSEVCLSDSCNGPWKILSTGYWNGEAFVEKSRFGVGSLVRWCPKKPFRERKWQEGTCMFDWKEIPIHWIEEKYLHAQAADKNNAEAQFALGWAELYLYFQVEDKEGAAVEIFIRPLIRKVLYDAERKFWIIITRREVVLTVDESWECFVLSHGQWEGERFVEKKRFDNTPLETWSSMGSRCWTEGRSNYLWEEAEFDIVPLAWSSKGRLRKVLVDDKRKLTAFITTEMLFVADRKTKQYVPSMQSYGFWDGDTFKELERLFGSVNDIVEWVPEPGSLDRRWKEGKTKHVWKEVPHLEINKPLIQGLSNVGIQGAARALKFAYEEEKRCHSGSEWLEKAAMQDHCEACEMLGCMFHAKFLNEGKEQDLMSARKWLMKSAIRGSIMSQGLLAYLAVTVQDWEEAKRWGQKSADCGHAFAMCAMGLYYHNRWRTSKSKSDERLGFSFFRDAAESGQSMGQIYLGRCYEEGFGVPQDLEKAREWKEKAKILSRIVEI